MSLPSLPQLLLLATAAPLAMWFAVLTLKPTPLWKSWWRAALASASPPRDAGLYALVFTFPPLLAASMAYLYLHLSSSKRTRIIPPRHHLTPTISNPLLFLSHVGMLSFLELISAALMASLLAWTFFWGLVKDFKKPTPDNLTSTQVMIMRVGIRMGSMAEICLALLFFPVLRRMAVLKLVGVQFESAVRYHTWIGNLFVPAAAAHGGAIISVWASKNVLISELTKWPKSGKVNLAGAIALALGLTIWVSSLPVVRRKNFQLFYSVHHLHVAFVVFFLLHAGAHHFYLVSAGVLLFGIDFLTRVNLSRPATSVISAKVLPCRAIELILSIKGVDYSPTSFMLVNVPAISKFQWHPFSITSSSSVDRGKVSFLIKCQGQWTNALHNLVISEKPFHVAVEGPYGPPSPPYASYEALIMVAGGSGITPFLSVLREASSRSALLYVVRNAEELSMLTSVSKLLQKKIKEKRLRVKIFVTGERKGFSVDYINEQATSTVFQFEESLSGFRGMAAAAGFSFIVFLVLLLGLSFTFTEIIRSEIIVLGSYVVAVAGGAAMAVFLSRRKTTSRGTESYGDQSKLEDENDGIDEEIEIIYGRRPVLEEEVEGMCMEMGGSEFGVFVCGPASMQEEVGKLCRPRSWNGKKGHGRSLSLAFHSISFSL